MAALETVEVLMAIARVIKTAVDLTPNIIKAVDDAKPFAQAIIEVLKGQQITDDQLADLEAKITALSNQLQKPLPPEEP